jgi:hypothetical protein
MSYVNGLTLLLKNLLTNDRSLKIQFFIKICCEKFIHTYNFKTDFSQFLWLILPAYTVYYRYSFKPPINTVLIQLSLCFEPALTLT